VNSIQCIQWLQVLDTVKTVEFVVRSRQTRPLLTDAVLKERFLDETTHISKFVYWARVNSLLLSPDFKVQGFGKSKKHTLSKLNGEWVEEPTEQQVWGAFGSRERADWTKIES
jgi:hypothetical protein